MSSINISLNPVNIEYYNIVNIQPQSSQSIIATIDSSQEIVLITGTFQMLINNQYYFMDNFNSRVSYSLLGPLDNNPNINRWNIIIENLSNYNVSANIILYLK